MAAQVQTSETNGSARRGKSPKVRGVPAYPLLVTEDDDHRNQSPSSAHRWAPQCQQWVIPSDDPLVPIEKRCSHRTHREQGLWHPWHEFRQRSDSGDHLQHSCKRGDWERAKFTYVQQHPFTPASRRYLRELIEVGFVLPDNPIIETVNRGALLLDPQSVPSLAAVIEAADAEEPMPIVVPAVSILEAYEKPSQGVTIDHIVQSLQWASEQLRTYVEIQTQLVQAMSENTQLKAERDAAREDYIAANKLMEEAQEGHTLLIGRVREYYRQLQDIGFTIPDRYQV